MFTEKVKPIESLEKARKLSRERKYTLESCTRPPTERQARENVSFKRVAEKAAYLLYYTILALFG
jgi:hypothetical protein